jgi:hypothetical protein
MRLKTFNRIMALFFIELLIFLPIYSSALTIGNVTVSDVSDKSALVEWQTDNESTTKINYGEDPASLTDTVESLRLVKNHTVSLRNLNKSTAYFFEVVSQSVTERVIDNNSGNFYQLVTLAEDTEPPFIDLDIPTHVDSNKVDIFGTTEINTRLELYINNQIVGSKIFYDGQVDYPRVDLIPNQQNAILVRAIDAAGLMNQKSYTVFSDLIAPEITMPVLPNVTNQSAVTITGTLSEIALFEILLNSSVVYSAETAAFSYNLALAEGVNDIIIRATDRAGHVEEISKTIISDTTVPTITDITPTAGGFYYEGRAIIDLSFNTEPGAEVRVFQDSMGHLKKYEDTKKADADGVVLFDDFELEGVHFGPYSISGEWPPIREVSAATAAITQSYQTIQQTEASERPVNLWIAVRDMAGHVAVQQVSYTIGTCWSGELDFLVLPLLEYQTPTLLSPQRLEEGSEIISFILSINYTGDAEDWTIEDITFDRACRGGRAGEPEFSFLEEDISYNVSCLILPDSPTTKERNSKGTLWYMRYDLASTAEFSEGFLEEIEQLGPGERELIFPLKLTVTYKEKEYDQVQKKDIWKTKRQTKCMSVGYFVDIPIDPRDILPDWMLGNLTEDLNDTINTLEGWIGNMTSIIEDVSTACLGSMITKFVVQIYRKISCKLESRAAVIAETAAKATGAGSGKPMCPKTEEGRRSLPLNKESRQGKKDTGVPDERIIRPVDFTKLDVNFADPTTVYLEARCSGCASAWKAEASLYQLERWTCDRIFCHKAPARWTGYDKGVEDIDVKKAEAKARACATEDRAGVAALRKIENCDQEYGKYATNPRITLPPYDTEKKCYQYANSLYVLDSDDVEPDEDGVYTLTKAYKDGPPKIEVLKEGNTFATAIDKECKEICKIMDSRSKVDGTGCELEKTCTEEKPELEPGYLAGYSKDCWTGQDALDKENKKQCCCRLPEDKDKKEAERLRTTMVNCEPGDKPGEDCQGWEYREQTLNRIDKKKYGTLYPTNRYFTGRDAPACFGQNYFWESPAKGKAGKQPKMDPFRQHISTFQCLCLTGIKQRLQFFQSILVGMRNCLLQIKETGEADAGVCQEMFSMYICDMLYQVFVWIRQGCIPLPFGKEWRPFPGAEIDEFGTHPSAESVFEIGMGSVWETFTGMGESVEAEYGSSQFSNFLSMEEKEISRKMCLAAFGFDIGLDFDTLQDLTYTQQFSSSVLALGLRRDFLTYNPDSEQSTYEYRGSWTIYPGCEITNYKIDLTCVNLQEKSQYSGIDCSVPENPDNPGGCDCLYSTEPYGQRSRNFYQGTALTAQTMEDRNHHTNVESSYRYDHMRMQLFLHPDSDPSKCLPERHSNGVFYFPISDRTARDILDCIVDERGIFRCSRGLEWEAKGEAYFETFTPAECHSSSSCDLLCYDHNPEIDVAGNRILWRNCDSVVYAVGNRVDIKAKIAGKKKQCLKTTITSENGNEVYNQVHDIGESGLEASYTKEQDLRLGNIPLSEFTSTGVQVTATGCSIVPLVSLDETNKFPGRTGTITISSPAADKYNIAKTTNIIALKSQGDPVETTDLTDLTEAQVKTRVFRLGGVAFKLTDIFSGTCTLNTQSFAEKAEQKWRLNIELMHPDPQGFCSRATERIFKIGYETDLDPDLRVVKQYDELCNRLKDLKKETLQNKLINVSSPANPLAIATPSTQFKDYACRLTKDADPNSIVNISAGESIEGKDKLCYGNRVCSKIKTTAAAAPAAVAGAPAAPVAPAGPGAAAVADLQITRLSFSDNTGQIDKPTVNKSFRILIETNINRTTRIQKSPKASIKITSTSQTIPWGNASISALDEDDKGGLWETLRSYTLTKSEPYIFEVKILDEFDNLIDAKNITETPKHPLVTNFNIVDTGGDPISKIYEDGSFFIVKADIENMRSGLTAKVVFINETGNEAFVKYLEHESGKTYSTGTISSTNYKGSLVSHPDEFIDEKYDAKIRIMEGTTVITESTTTKELIVTSGLPPFI